MKSLTIILLAFLMAFVMDPPRPSSAQDQDRPPVVLLHGLVRSSASMRKMQRALDEAGYRTCNVAYPSTKHPIATLAREHVVPAINACLGDVDTPIHFVTHSLGGILVRYIDEHELIPATGRVVMLSPPNKGSEVVDAVGDSWLFGAINGPAGRELGTDAASVPNLLGEPGFELGIITGSRSINLINSLMIEGKDDGKVSVERAGLEGMKDFLVLPVAHPFIMKRRQAIEQTLHFLEHGAFRDNA